MSKKRILVVDDSETSRMFVKESLESLGYEVAEAADGEQALQKVQERAPDLLIMDVIMPEMTGWDLCARIKGSSDRGQIPIIIITTKDKEHDMLRSFESGADEFLNKPINVDELAASIERLLTRTSEANNG